MRSTGNSKEGILDKQQAPNVGGCWMFSICPSVSILHPFWPKFMSRNLISLTSTPCPPLSSGFLLSAANGAYCQVMGKQMERGFRVYISPHPARHWSGGGPIPHYNSSLLGSLSYSHVLQCSPKSCHCPAFIRVVMAFTTVSPWVPHYSWWVPLTLSTH